MNRKSILAAAIFAAISSTPTVTLAGANDYAFEPMKAEVKQGGDTTIAVRLIHKPTGKPVAGAMVVRTRLDMSPEAMGEMVSAVSPLASSEPGVYAFKTTLSMQGRWLLSIAARVQGEPETIVGKIIFKAAP